MITSPGKKYDGFDRSGTEPLLSWIKNWNRNHTKSSIIVDEAYFNIVNGVNHTVYLYLQSQQCFGVSLDQVE